MHAEQCGRRSCGLARRAYVTEHCDLPGIARCRQGVEGVLGVQGVGRAAMGEFGVYVGLGGGSLGVCRAWRREFGCM